MNELTRIEEDILEAADGLLRESRGPVRYLDIVRKAVMAYTSDERARKAWDTFEASVSAMGREQDPEAYCGECEGKGERMVATTCCDGRDCGCYGRGSQSLEECAPCAGTGFIGYPKRLAMPLYSPGDETLEPAF